MNATNFRNSSAFKMFWQRVASLVKFYTNKKKNLLRAERPRYEYSASVLRRFVSSFPSKYRVRPPHTSRFFVAELQIFCRAQICRDISLPHISRFFVATNRVLAWGQVDFRHVGKDACSRDSHENSLLVEVRASPDKLSWLTAH